MEAEQAAEWGATLDAYRLRLQDERMPAPERRALQDGANPAYIPRNALMQGAIAAAEAGDFDEVRRLVPLAGRAGHQALMTQGGADRINGWCIAANVNSLDCQGPCASDFVQKHEPIVLLTAFPKQQRSAMCQLACRSCFRSGVACQPPRHVRILMAGGCIIVRIMGTECMGLRRSCTS